MQEKRQIKSEAELVNALELEIKVEYSDKGNWIDYEGMMNFHQNDVLAFHDTGFRYSDPVEVVELWGWKGELLERYWFEPFDPEARNYTHKQTQIHLNGEIIWTETEKIL